MKVDSISDKFGSEILYVGCLFACNLLSDIPMIFGLVFILDKGYIILGSGKKMKMCLDAYKVYIFYLLNP